MQYLVLHIITTVIWRTVRTGGGCDLVFTRP